MKNILIVEDHPLYRAAIEEAIGREDFELSSVNGLTDAVLLLQNDRVFDLILLDLQIPGVIGFEGVAKLRETQKSAKIVMLSAYQSDELVSKAIYLGADGYLSKSLSSEELIDAIDRVLGGERVIPDGVQLQHQHQMEQVDLDNIVERVNSLTPQQLVILKKLCDGKLNKQIAFDLDISETTVKAHITAILRKLGVVNRTQAVLVTQSARLVDDEPRFEGERA